MHSIVDSRLQRQASLRKQNLAECETDARRRGQLQASLLAKRELSCAGGGMGDDQPERTAIQELADRHRQREERYRFAMQDARVRIQPLGQDRDGRDYWLFDHTPEVAVTFQQTGHKCQTKAFKTPAELEALDKFLSHHLDRPLQRALSRCLPLLPCQARENKADTALREADADRALGWGSRAPADHLPQQRCSFAGRGNSSAGTLLFDDHDARQGQGASPVSCNSMERVQLSCLPGDGVERKTWGAEGIEEVKQHLLALDDMLPWCDIASQAGEPAHSSTGACARARATAARAWVARQASWRRQVKTSCGVEGLVTCALDVGLCLEQLGRGPASAGAEGVDGGSSGSSGSYQDDDMCAKFWAHDEQADAWRALLGGEMEDTSATHRHPAPAKHLSSVALAVLLLAQRARGLICRLKLNQDSLGSAASGRVDGMMCCGTCSTPATAVLKCS